MPGFRVHLLGGVCAFGLVATIIAALFPLDLFTAVPYLCMALLGSLFPDVDITSKGQGLFYKAMTVCLLVLLMRKSFIMFVIAAFIAMVPLLVRHRGLFHQPWFLIAVPTGIGFWMATLFPLYKIKILYSALFFSAGALSHILFDRLF